MVNVLRKHIEVSSVTSKIIANTEGITNREGKMK